MYAENHSPQETLDSRNFGFPAFFCTRILVIQGCRTDLIGTVPTVDSSLAGLILEIGMKPGEIDLLLKTIHL